MHQQKALSSTRVKEEGRFIFDKLLHSLKAISRIVVMVSGSFTSVTEVRLNASYPIIVTT